MKLDRFVSAAIGAQGPDQVEHQVLRINARRELPAEDDLECLRHLHPQLAGDPHRCDFGIANAGSERAQAAVNGAVRIGADDQIARCDVSRFHQHQVRDTGVDIVKLVDPVGAREIAAHLLIGGVFLGFRGRDVVQDHSQPVRIVELGRADFLHHADRSPRRRVAHHQVGIGVDDLAWLDGCAAGFRREDLFSDRISQFKSLLLT